MKYLTYVVIAVVVASIAVGLYFVGSPQRARDIRFDERRINDLQSIQYNVFYYWERNKKLPDTLEQSLSYPAGDYAKDPESKQPYEYRVLAPEKFELCAVFSLPTSEQNNSTGPRSYYKEPYYIGDNSWDHPEGRACFTRTIDKEQYLKDHPLPAPVR